MSKLEIKSFPKNEIPLQDYNKWADFWRNDIGVNVIPADTKNKTTNIQWSQWQNNPIPIETHEKWKSDNRFFSGMAIIVGKVWHNEDHKDKYFTFIDLDNQKAIDEVCNIFGAQNLIELSKYIIVEQHSDNISKAHLYFYSKHIFQKKSSDIVKQRSGIMNNQIPAIEVKGLGQHGLAYCTPSVHITGKHYEILGSLRPKTCDKKVEDLLLQIFKSYNLGIEETGKMHTSKLFESKFEVLEGHNRHEALMRTMESLMIRIGPVMSNEQIKNIAHQWNEEKCKPPLTYEEFEKQWKCAIKFVNQKGIKLSSFESLPETLNITDGKLIFKVYETHPVNRIYFVDELVGQVKSGKLQGDAVIPEKSILDIAPKSITYFKNSLFPEKNIRIQLNCTHDYTIGPFDSIKDILSYLENSGNVLNHSKAHDALSNIISALKDSSNVTHTDRIDTKGFYYIEGNDHHSFKSQDVYQKSEISKDEVVACCDLLDKLVKEGWKNSNILPTVVKWSIIAPFSFILKSIHRNSMSSFFPWLMLYGESQTGKTTLGQIAGQIWRIPNSEFMKGFEGVSTAARFGHVISRSTYPILINETGALSQNNFGKQTPMIDMIKNSVESKNCRGIQNRSGERIDIPALSPCIFTSNHKLIEESGFIRRFISVHFPVTERKTSEETKLFSTYNLSGLGSLGDFVASQITIDKLILFGENWEELSKELLKDFYNFAGKTEPDWSNKFEDQIQVTSENENKKYYELRNFLISEILQCYNRNKRSFGIGIDNEINVDVVSALNFCLRNGLLPYIREIKDEIIITIDIHSRISIAGITHFKDLASVLGFEYVNKRLSSTKTARVLVGKRSQLLNILLDE